ncbi:OmpA family protein [Pontibacter sp. CAU 1760]
MKRLLTISVLLLSWQLALGQHDLYKWQLSGYTGIAAYSNDANRFSDYYSVHDNLLYRAELTRSIGNSLGLSVGYALGNVRGRDLQRNAFETEVHMAALRGYFYTDNGWLFNSSAWMSPYVFGGYSLSILETSGGAAKTESRYVSTIPVGIGLKFRLGERWQLGLQTEAVYLTEPHLEGLALEQNDYNSAYLHTGVTVGYSFGFRKSTFKAPQYYSSTAASGQGEEQTQPQQNVLEMMLKLPSKTTQLEQDQSVSTITEEQTQRTIFAPADTLQTRNTTIVTDSSLVQRKRVVQGVPPQTRQIQDTTNTPDPTPTVTATTVEKSETAEDKVKQQEAQPIPATSERSTLRPDTVVQRQAATVTQKQPQPTTISPEKVTPTKGQETPLKTESKAPAKAEVEATSKTTERTRVKERVVYVQDAAGEAAQSDQEKQQLAAVNAENRRLQAHIDSLQTMLPTDDTLHQVAAVDTSLVQYLQRQADLNDSVLYRLNQYERELALLQQAKTAAVAPAAVPKAYTTTVYYPVNTFKVPLESLRDLNQVVQKLQEMPAITAQLTGYSSQSGNAAYNLALSRKRVEALVDFLTVQGIDKARIRVQYMGDAAASQKENPLDRKVEIEVVD